VVQVAFGSTIRHTQTRTSCQKRCATSVPRNPVNIRLLKAGSALIHAGTEQLALCDLTAGGYRRVTEDLLARAPFLEGDNRHDRW